MKIAPLTVIQQQALALLNELVAAGREFPDAIHTVKLTHMLSERSLRQVVEAYDAGVAP